MKARTPPSAWNERLLPGANAGERLYQDMRRHSRMTAAHQAVASIRTLTGTYGISYGTVCRVIGRLVEEGHLYAVRGKGVFVAEGARVAESQGGGGTLLYVEDWSDTTHPFCIRKLLGVLEAAEKNGLRVQVLKNPDPAAVVPDRQVLDEAARPDVAGLALPVLTKSAFARIRERRPELPIVTQFTLTGDAHVARVDLDGYALAYQAAQYLCGQGARSILLAFKQAESIGGMAAAIHEAGRPVQAMHEECRPGNAPGALAETILAHRPEGLLFTDDRSARDILKLIGARDPDYLRETKVASHANAGEDILPPGVVRFEWDGYDLGAAIVAALVMALGKNPLSNMVLRIQPRRVEQRAAAVPPAPLETGIRR